MPSLKFNLVPGMGFRLFKLVLPITEAWLMNQDKCIHNLATKPTLSKV